MPDQNVKPIIIAGGRGNRLRPITDFIQKCMLPVGREQKPLLHHIVTLFRAHGFRRLLILAGYKAQQVKGYFGDGEDLGVEITYGSDNGRLGTGGALLRVQRQGLVPTRGTLLVYYGDILSNINLQALVSQHLQRRPSATLAVAPRYRVPVGVVKTDGLRVLEMREKPHIDLNVTIGILALEAQALDELGRSLPREGRIDLMGDIIPHLLETGRPVDAYIHRGEWVDIGTLESYEKLDPQLVDRIIASYRDYGAETRLVAAK
jgi:mannose-1-phosphate guanylyltransferase